VHKTQIEFDLAESLPPVRGDRTQLQQLTLSLVRNAIESLTASETSGRQVKIRTCLVPDGRVEVSVSDNGPGVAPEMVERLFIPFATTKANGTGLGLSISQTIAQAHGGTIGYRPCTPAGACFFVRLPTAEDLE
jgi:C4-dicarboxylate-specific signal transduction histidine kinase